MSNVPTKILKVAGKFGSYGEDGATFIPHVTEDGQLSWENNKGLDNPASINIIGPEGPMGPAGPKGESPLPEVTADDNGKFARVVEGTWAAVAVDNAEEASF